MILTFRDKVNAVTTRWRLQKKFDLLLRHGWKEPRGNAIETKFLENRIRELSRQIEEFDLLRTERTVVAEPIELPQIPDYLIARRIRCGVSQQELASRLGFSGNAICKYEKSRYSGASLGRILQIDAAIQELESTREFEILWLLEQDQMNRQQNQENSKITGLLGSSSNSDLS